MISSVEITENLSPACFAWDLMRWVKKLSIILCIFEQNEKRVEIYFFHWVTILVKSGAIAKAEN